MMKPFAYASASTVEEVVQALNDGCRPLAGGTDLIALMKRGLVSPERLVNLKTIAEMRGIEDGEDSWRIGALTTLSDLAASHAPPVEKHLPVLFRALVESATPQLRHAATLGGNLVQRPRCWYFRNPLIQCWLKGGSRCFAAKGRNAYHAILGGGPCYIVHPSDPAVALAALDARVEVTGPGGSRRVDLTDFFVEPRSEARSETVLEANELVTAVFVPTPPADARGAYVKIAERAAWDFALVSAAVQVCFDGDTVSNARVVLGGVASAPWRARDAEEALAGRLLTPDAIEAAARASTAGAAPLAENGYKVELAQGAVQEALRRLQHVSVS